jgi:cyclic lactone autoinducer peptide
MAVRLCDTAWAKEHNRNPATLRIFPFGSTGIMLLGVVSLSVVAACWWQIYQPEGVWLPYLAGNSMHKPGNGPSIRVAEVSQHGQTVLVRIICDKIPHAGELTPVFSGPLFELPYVLPAEVTNVDCLLTTAPHTYDGKTIAGTNVLSGKPSFLLGFMLPDEQAAATAVALIKRLNLGKLHGLDSPLFILRRNLGKDANGKPIAEEICCWIELRAKSAAKKPETSNFYIGQAYFPKGDSIEITSIERTADSMTAKGRYSLASADSAMLALYITTTNSGSTRTDPKQTMQISKGSGEFELTYPHAISGWPHLSMYGDDGTPFATLYFGNKEETAEERKLDLGHDPTAGGAETRSPDMSPDDYPLVINAEHFDILHPPEPGQLDWRFNCFIPPDHLASLLFVCWSNGVPAINPGYCTYFKVGKTGGIDLFCSISCYRLASQSEFSKLNEDERQRILANCGYPESAGVTNAVWWNVNLGAGFTAGSLIAMPPLTRDDIQFPQSVHSGHQRVIPLAGFDRPEGDGNAGRSGVELRILLEPLRLPPIRVVPNEVDRTNYVSGSGLAGTMEEALNAIKTLPVEPTDDGSQLASPATNSSQQSLRERFVNRTAQDQEKYTPQQLHDAEQLYLVANQRWGTAEAKESLQTMIREYPDINRTGCAVLYLAQMSQGDERARYLQDCIDKYNDCFYGDGVQVGAYARFLLAGDCQSRGETGKAGALFDEIKTQYAGAIDHQGNLLVPEEPFLQQQLKLANAGNYWAKFKLWQAFSQGEVPVFDLHGHRTGKHEATKDPAEAGKWLAELVKGAYLAKFEPVNGFNPKTPKEMLDQFNEHCELHSGKDSLGGASFFRTTKQGEKLIGSFLTSTPDEFKKAIEQNPNFRLISIEVVTPEMFLSHEAARQESL